MLLLDVVWVLCGYCTMTMDDDAGEGLVDAGKGLASAVLSLNSRGVRVLYTTPSDACTLPTQASVYKQLELPRSARMQHCSALVDTR